MEGVASVIKRKNDPSLLEGKEVVMYSKGLVYVAQLQEGDIMVKVYPKVSSCCIPLYYKTFVIPIDQCRD